LSTPFTICNKWLVRKGRQVFLNPDDPSISFKLYLLPFFPVSTGDKLSHVFEMNDIGHKTEGRADGKNGQEIQGPEAVECVTGKRDGKYSFTNVGGKD
jgi:hypothetical protein